MAKGFFRERKHYSIYEISENLGENVEETRRLADLLKKYGILKTVKESAPEFEDLSEQDLVLTAPSEGGAQVRYRFEFVGVVTLGGHVFKCYPKYISAAEPLKQLKKVLQVIRKYQAKEQKLYSYHGERDFQAFNRLAVSLHLLEEYFRYGVYSNSREVVEVNGEGEILWDRTVNETDALIQKGRPYYTQLLTLSAKDNEADYFRRLHQCILGRCSAELKELGILELFDLREVELSDLNLAAFGGKDYILYRLQREMQIQYVTWKQDLLKTLYTYIANENSDKNKESFGLYGTNSFPVIWEKVCAEGFGNMLEEKTENLPGAVPVEGKAGETLKDLIDRPVWGRREPKACDDKSCTLRPDIIRIYPYNDAGDYCFGIFDAKYYCIDFIRQKDGWRVTGQPGVGDVTKQYLYQMAFRDFIAERGYRRVRNVFLCPGEEESGEYGYVEMGMLQAAGLERILVVKLCAEEMYDRYLSGRQIENVAEIIEKEQDGNREPAIQG